MIIFIYFCPAGQMAQLVLDSLIQLIMATGMKVDCAYYSSVSKCFCGSILVWRIRLRSFGNLVLMFSFLI